MKSKKRLIAAALAAVVAVAAAYVADVDLSQETLERITDVLSVLLESL